MPTERRSRSCAQCSRSRFITTTSPACRCRKPLAEADRIGEEEARTPFVLEVAPLIRVTMISLAPGNARLLVTMHHAICDGWSIGVLSNELTRSLAGAPDMPELPLQYGDYAEWQQAWLREPGVGRRRGRIGRRIWRKPALHVTVPPDRPAEERGAGRHQLRPAVPRPDGWRWPRWRPNRAAHPSPWRWPHSAACCRPGRERPISPSAPKSLDGPTVELEGYDRALHQHAGATAGLIRHRRIGPNGFPALQRSWPTRCIITPCRSSC